MKSRPRESYEVAVERDPFRFVMVALFVEKRKTMELVPLILMLMVPLVHILVIMFGFILRGGSGPIYGAWLVGVLAVAAKHWHLSGVHTARELASLPILYSGWEILFFGISAALLWFKLPMFKPTLTDG